MTPLTREWLSKAESDLRGARALLAVKPRQYDAVCFHCQQAVEKYLKALLQEHVVSFPKTHVLENLVDRLLPIDPTLRPLRAAAKRTTRYAVDFRYPGDRAARRQALAALAVAARFRAEIRRRLGLRA